MRVMVESNEARAEQAKSVFTPNYRPAPVVIERGEGCWVFDVEGRRYLDLIGGIAVSSLGHGHPELVAAVQAQAAKVMHTSNLFLNRPAVELADALVESSFGKRVFFCNSGAEANEAQMKLARRYAWDRGEKRRNRIITFEGSFHGRTLGALAATAQPKYQEGFGPMPEGFIYLPYGDVAALEKTVDDTVAAILIEPIQGEGGVRVAPRGFLGEVRRIASARGALLLLDEVQVGVGRTGRLFAYEHEGVVPDIMSLAKGLGGGLPIGAIVASEEVGSHLVYGAHGTTFGGNPVACAAGLVVLNTVRSERFLAHVSAVGRVFADGLRDIALRHRVFKEVRGGGLLIGAELDSAMKFDAKALVDACRHRGLLAHTAGTNVLRLAPPLIITESEVREALDVIDRVVHDLMA